LGSYMYLRRSLMAWASSRKSGMKALLRLPTYRNRFPPRKSVED
jgi:hypothetical protein